MATMTISKDSTSQSLEIPIPDRIVKLDEGIKAFGKEKVEAGYCQGMTVRLQTFLRRKCKDNFTVASLVAAAKDWKPGEGRVTLTPIERFVKLGYTEAEAKRMLAAKDPASKK